MQKKFLLGFALGFVLICQTGCATIFSGKYQQVTVNTMNDKFPKSTQCVLTNEEGEWRTWANITTTIHRDGNEMDIHCENDEQAGNAKVKPSFQGLYLVLDILWDYCILTASCIIDGATNSFYEYPTLAVVDMNSKQAMQENKTVQQQIKPKQQVKQDNGMPF